MNKYEKILKEICYLIRLRNKFYNEINKERKTLENITKKLIYEELYKDIEWLFENIEEDKNENTS